MVTLVLILLRPLLSKKKKIGIPKRVCVSVCDGIFSRNGAYLLLAELIFVGKLERRGR